MFYGNVIKYTKGEINFIPKIHRTLRDLLDELCEYYGEFFRNFINGDETCVILINGMGTAFSGGLDSPLRPGDKIEVLPFAEAG
ncbi:MAG: MoaD/ThiS family protein [Oscillospiraceae bacterium]|nr:MoaD/ThiS family protein [Oscillospiraceae bacterium]